MTDITPRAFSVKRIQILSISALLTTLTWLNCHAEIYKWTDENGNVVFSERKPSTANINVEEVKPKTGAPSRAEQEQEAGNAPAKQTKSSDRAEELEEKRKKEQLQAEKEAELTKRNCTEASKWLASLQRPRVNRINEDGTRRVLGEEERLAGIQEAEKAVAEWCK